MDMHENAKIAQLVFPFDFGLFSKAQFKEENQLVRFDIIDTRDLSLSKPFLAILATPF